MGHILSLAASQADNHFWTVMGGLMLIAMAGLGLFFFGIFRGETKKSSAVIMLIGILLMVGGVAAARIYGR